MQIYHICIFQHLDNITSLLTGLTLVELRKSLSSGASLSCFPNDEHFLNELTSILKVYIQYTLCYVSILFIDFPNYLQKCFEKWTPDQQEYSVKCLLAKMCHYQHSRIDSYLRPMLQRDFVTLLACMFICFIGNLFVFFENVSNFPAKGLSYIAEHILSYLDSNSLCQTELVSRQWRRIVSDGLLWKKLIERKVCSDPLWKGLSEKRKWWFFGFFMQKMVYNLF